MDVLLTGASGFVGRHLLVALAKKHRVVAMSRRPTGAPGEIIHDFADHLPGDRLPRRIDSIIHTAGIVGRQADWSSAYTRVNVEATNELAEYAIRAGAKRFVLFSTGGVYRRTEQQLTEESVVAPADEYARSKLAAELAVQTIKGELAVQVLRLFFPFGPTQRGRLIPNLIERIAQDKPIRLANDIGQPLVTPLYIDDLIEYVRRVLFLPDSFVANVAGAETASIRTLSNIIAGVLNRTALFEVSEEMEIYNWQSDNDLISRLTEYSCRVSVQAGIERTVAEMHI